MIRADADPSTTGTVDPDANGLGVPGYWNSGPICTIFGPDAANHIQEEISRVIEGEGVTLDFADKGQFAEIFGRTTGIYGDGSDGDVVQGISTSLITDVFYESFPPPDRDWETSS